MKLSIETHTLRNRFGNDTAVKMIRDAGFDAYDFSFYGEYDLLSDDFQEKAHALRALSDSLGISCNQAHAPMDMKGTDTFCPDNPSYHMLCRSMEAASILGAPHIIVHAVSTSLPSGVGIHEFNRAFYSSLFPLCEKHNIRICAENISGCFRDPAELNAFVTDMDSPWLRVCADIGHFALAGFKPEEALLQLDPELFAGIHVQDNNLLQDDHLLPWWGQLNWDGITRSLAKVGYQGDLTLEIFKALDRQDPQNLPAALKFAEQTGRLLIQKIRSA